MELIKKALMKIAISFAASIALLGPAFANAECHFKSESAIVCKAAKNAATAITRFGHNTNNIEKSHNIEILRAAQCGIPYKGRYKIASIEQVNSGKVAVATGWVQVATIIVDRRDIYYIAHDYLEGNCKKFVPETHVIQTLPQS